MNATRSIALFGTDEVPAESRVFHAGPLSFTFEAGAIRHLRFQGREVLRGIQYLIRDADWATPAMTLSEPVVRQTEEGIDIAFKGKVEVPGIEFGITAQINASNDGILSFRVRGEAGSDLKANRIGFTLLHPTPICEGRPLVVTHLDRQKEQTRFPALISPSQPVFDIAALEYDIEGGIQVNCELKSHRPGGRIEPFEMEDQRNWSDASYKTYVGTLLEELPYPVFTGDVFEQETRVSCRRSGDDIASDSDAADPVLQLSIDKRSSTVLPALVLAVPDGLAQDALMNRQALADLRANGITAWVKADDPELEKSVASIAALADALGVGTDLEIELAEQHSPDEELARIARTCRQAGVPVDAVLACPRAYLRSYQPNGQWPEVAPLESIYAAARRHFPLSRIGGGMLTYFTELNRKWPPAENIDFVSHGLAPVVHAADDRTVMENLSTVPSMAATIRERYAAMPYRIGPSAISMRHNPYGSATVGNAAGRRIAMCDADPREGGIFGASWALGLAATARASGAERLCLFAAAGPRSVLETEATGLAAPTTTAAYRPVYHVFAGLAQFAGCRCYDVIVVGGDESNLAALAVEEPQGDITLWLANLCADTLKVQLPVAAGITMLDAGAFEQASTASGWFTSSAPASSSRTLKLDHYAVARCRLSTRPEQ